MTIWLSPEQAAERTPVSRKTIYNAIRRRELRAAKRRGRWFIAEDALEAWLEADPAASPPALGRRKTPQRGAHRAPAGSLAKLREIETGASTSL